MRKYLYVVTSFIVISLGLTAGKPVRVINHEVFFSDGTTGLEPEEKEGFLNYLLDYNASRGLYSISHDTLTAHIWRVSRLDVELWEQECSGVSYGSILGMGHYLIGGVEGLKKRKFPIMTPDAYIFPEVYQFEFEGRGYELFATGTYDGEEYDWAKDVEIKFRDLEKGIVQILTIIPQLESSLPSVLFIGDIDDDGKPDLILQEGYNYEYSEKVLYLSSLAGEGELLGVAGVWGMWHDC